MEIPKGIRRVFPPISTNIRPNSRSWRRPYPKARKHYCPDFPVQYQVPVDAESWASLATGLARPAKQGLPVVRQEVPTRPRQRPSLDSLGYTKVPD